jgi:hypothetical protein
MRIKMSNHNTFLHQVLNILMSYAEWNPGIENGDATLQSVIDTLPGNDSIDISLFVKLIENPRSPFSLPGAISLEAHDCVHAIVGRGLLNQDEAFVIGYTMGNASKLKYWQISLYKYYATYIFPKIYRFGERELIAFDLGITFGRTRRTKDIHKVDFEHYKNRTMGEVRALFDVNVDILRHLRYIEGRMFKSKASRRL